MNDVTSKLSIEEKEKQLKSACRDMYVFEYENVMFKGNYVDAVKKYITEGSSVDFLEWLKDNNEMLEVVRPDDAHTS